jgi:cytochrome c peroxidase
MRLQSFVLITSAAGLLLTGCAKKADEPVVVEKSKLVLFKPLPELMPAKSGPPSEEMIALGRVLYYEKRLSKDQDHSCNSCHNLQTYGVDNKATSDGFKGQLGDRNSPTVYNAAGHFVQFWDGRAADVEEQAKGPVLNPVEMALPDAKSAESVLRSMPEYVDMFKKAFPEDRDPVTFDNMAKAIGAFERKLTTPSRWDKYLAGDESALTNDEKKGFLKFVEAGCQTCHAGTLVGGNLYQKLGAAKEFPDQSDPGRMKVTKAEADKMVFKVPSLRNIEKTGPYYHNGKVTSLEEATSMMAELQLGKTLKPEEVASIVTWMKSLTGEIPADYIKEPPMPKSTPKTPKPVTAD